MPNLESHLTYRKKKSIDIIAKIPSTDKFWTKMPGEHFKQMHVYLFPQWQFSVVFFLFFLFVFSTKLKVWVCATHTSIRYISYAPLLHSWNKLSEFFHKIAEIGKNATCKQKIQQEIVTPVSFESWTSAIWMWWSPLWDSEAHVTWQI